MLLVRGRAVGTALTGTLYERDEQPPSFAGVPEATQPYVWLCDSFYEVDSGGTTQEIDGREINVAFEPPFPQGFQTRQAAIKAAKEHLRTQFARIGVDPATVTIETDPVDAADSVPSPA